MRPDPETLRALALRCEAGDETLSDDVWRTLGYTRWTGDLWNFPDTLGPIRLGDLCRSLDAQAALGVRITNLEATHSWPEKVWGYLACAWVEDTHHRSWCQRAPTEPLARLAAILRALAVRAEAGE